jgi:hypothetical protein
MFRAALVAALLVMASAFGPASLVSVRARPTELKMIPKDLFTNAVKEWKEMYPVAYNAGWGPTTKAERWNGRHAMFGWIALLATGYAKSHGLIPNADTVLDMKDWGTLAYIYGGSITNERAVVIVGHLHLLLFSVCAAVAPLSFQDKLYLEKGEEHEPAAGLFVPIVPGLTKQAEMLNGRLAMLGLVVLMVTSTVTQTSILDTINVGMGGKLF